MADKDKLEPVPDIDYLGRISSEYAALSKSQKRIAKYILENREAVVHYSITQLANKTRTAPSTITRFCQALSYKGFSELKVYLEKNLISETVSAADIQETDTLPVIIQKQLSMCKSAITDTLRTLNAETIAKVVDAIINAGAVHLYGQSGGYISSLYGKQMLLRVGVCCQAFNDNVDMNLAASTLKRGDVAICIAYSGEIKSVVDAISKASANKAAVVAITATPNSSMAKIANYVLSYSYNIPDSLQYLYIGSMCEVAILGAIQAELLRRTPNRENIEVMKQSVLSNRIK